MKKKILGMLAVAALLLVTGCPQANTDKSKEGGNDKGTPKQEQPKVEKTVDVAVNEFVKALEIGTVYITVGEEVAMIRFDDAEGVTYIGSGAVSASGAVSCKLEKVGAATADAKKVLVFEGVYHKAHEASFTVKRLGESYPMQEKILLNEEVGTVENTHQNYTKYIKDLKGGKSAVFNVTLTDTMVLVTAVYERNQEVVSKEAPIAGEMVSMDLRLGAVAYDLQLSFEAASGKKKGWQLKKDGFRLFEKTVQDKYEGVMIDDSIVTKAAVRLYKEETDAYHKDNAAPLYAKSLGTLQIRMEGSVVHFALTQNAANAGVLGGGAVGAKQERSVRLVPMKGRPGLYESLPLKSASVQVKTLTANEGHTIKTGLDTVFAFVHTDNASYKDVEYNTYDVKVTEYNPVTKQFVLRGMYELKKKPTDATPKAEAGVQLILEKKGDDLHAQPIAGSVDMIERFVQGE